VRQYGRLGVTKHRMVLSLQRQCIHADILHSPTTSRHGSSTVH